MIAGIPTSVLVILPITGLILPAIWLDYPERRYKLLELARLVTTVFVTTSIAAAIVTVLTPTTLSVGGVLYVGAVGTVLFMTGNTIRAVHTIT